MSEEAEPDRSGQEEWRQLWEPAGERMACSSWGPWAKAAFFLQDPTSPGRQGLGSSVAPESPRGAVRAAAASWHLPETL